MPALRKTNCDVRGDAGRLAAARGELKAAALHIPLVGPPACLRCLANLKPILDPCVGVGAGVYFLCWHDGVVYVGMSTTSITGRIGMHADEKVFDRAYYLNIDADIAHPGWHGEPNLGPVLEEVESVYIGALRPPYNHNVRGRFMLSKKPPILTAEGVFAAYGRPGVNPLALPG